MTGLYVAAILIGLLGLSLLIAGRGEGEPLTLFEITLLPQITKGLGIIACISSVVLFLAAFGGLGSPNDAGRRG